MDDREEILDLNREIGRLRGVISAYELDISKQKRMAAFGNYVRCLIRLHTAIAAEDEKEADVIRDEMDAFELDGEETRMVNRLSVALYLWHEDSWK